MTPNGTTIGKFREGKSERENNSHIGKSSDVKYNICVEDKD
jgi:hypothetical protein